MSRSSTVWHRIPVTLEVALAGERGRALLLSAQLDGEAEEAKRKHCPYIRAFSVALTTLGLALQAMLLLPRDVSLFEYMCAKKICRLACRISQTPPSNQPGSRQLLFSVQRSASKLWCCFASDLTIKGQHSESRKLLPCLSSIRARRHYRQPDTPESNLIR